MRHADSYDPILEHDGRFVPPKVKVLLYVWNRWCRKKKTKDFHQQAQESVNEKNTSTVHIISKRKRKAEGEPSTSRKKLKQEKTGPKRHTSFKSSILSLINSFKKFNFSKEQLSEMEKTPFWSMIKLFVYDDLDIMEFKKKDRVIVKILERWSIEKQAFEIGGSYLKMESIDIKLCFGLVCSNKPIKVARMGRPTNHPLLELAPKASQLKHAIITQALQNNLERPALKENAETVAKFVILYILSSTFLTSSFKYLKWGVLEYVEDVSKRKEYDLASFINSHLTNSLNDMKKGREKDCKGFVQFVVSYSRSFPANVKGLQIMYNTGVQYAIFPITTPEWVLEP